MTNPERTRRLLIVGLGIVIVVVALIYLFLAQGGR
jgi:hypothetical protein